MPYAPQDEALNDLSVEIETVVADARLPARFVLVASGAMRVVLLALPPGHQTSSHVHPHADETFYVVKGRADFVINGARLTSQGPGTVLLAQRGFQHSLSAAQSGPALVLCIVAPNEDRDDEEVTGRVPHDRS
jgi:mannose-6-phosphate isomerase-like protein (cupin superfamily)